MVSKIQTQSLKENLESRKENRRNITDQMLQQNKETRLKNNYFIFLFQRKFNEYFEEDYELRGDRFYNKKFVPSDKKRLYAIRWKLSLRQDNQIFWLKYLDFAIDKWLASKITSVNNLIGFLENPLIMKDFFVQKKIAYRRDKGETGIKSRFNTKSGHRRDWNE